MVKPQGKAGGGRKKGGEGKKAVPYMHLITEWGKHQHLGWEGERDKTIRVHCNEKEGGKKFLLSLPGNRERGGGRERAVYRL